MKRTLGFVLLSGGVDSATALTFAIKQLGQQNIRCVSVDYGQRHSQELDYAHKLAEYYGRPHSILNLAGIIPHTLLKDPSTEMPNVTYADIKGVSPSYVPYRNGLMLSALTSYVHGQLILEQAAIDRSSEQLGEGPLLEAILYAGMHAEDAAGGAYPDCTIEFIGSMANAIKVGTYDQIRLITPWIFSMKEDIVDWGDIHDTPYYLTWSCYAGGAKHCGRCSTCYARAAAFINAYVSDPTEYENDPIPVLQVKKLIKTPSPLSSSSSSSQSSP